MVLLPEHPAGEIVLSDEEMAHVNGGIVFTDNPRGCHSTDTSPLQVRAL
ncbi:MAG: mersacidin/lichenicidin family type 2 lantibiotic [Ktedonobacteraceae bacterium]